MKLTYWNQHYSFVRALNQKLKIFPKLVFNSILDFDLIFYLVNLSEFHITVILGRTPSVNS